MRLIPYVGFAVSVAAFAGAMYGGFHFAAIIWVVNMVIWSMNAGADSELNRREHEQEGRD